MAKQWLEVNSGGEVAERLECGGFITAFGRATVGVRCESSAEDAALQTLRAVYAESFKGAAHLDNIIQEAQRIVTAALK